MCYTGRYITLKNILNFNILISAIFFVQNKKILYFCQNYHKQNWMFQKFREDNLQMQFSLADFVFGLLCYVI